MGPGKETFLNFRKCSAGGGFLNAALLLGFLLDGCTAPPERLDVEPTAAGAVAEGPEAPDDRSLAPFVPTPPAVVTRMLEMAEVGPSDVVYDLGCGDGRIVIEAARNHGARAVGIDYDLRLCEQARERAREAGVAHLVEIRHEDVTAVDFSEATVVTLYLLPSANAMLRPKLLRLRPGTRIVSHDFDIEGWPPAARSTVLVRGIEEHRVFLWRVGQGPAPP